MIRHECTFHDLLTRNLEHRADHVAVVDGTRQVTYAEIDRRAGALAAWLADHGIRRGDRVGVHLRKSIEEVVGMFAAARLGAVIVNINHQWSLQQLQYVLEDCQVKALVSDQRPAEALARAGRPATLEHVVVHGTIATVDPAFVPWSTVPADRTVAPHRGIDTDLAALLYTSGSTGKPKGVMLTNLNLLNGARSVAEYVRNVPEDRLLSLLPFSFDYGLNQLTTMFLVGGTVVLQGVMMPAEIVKQLVKERITGFAAVPPAWIPVVRYLEEVQTALPDLRYITNSGGKIPTNTLEVMPKVFPGVQIFLMYGLTEAFRSTYLPPELFHRKMGSMGQAIPNVETFIVDEEIGICGPGQQGELVHRGSLVSLGYWGKPEATAEKIRPCPQLRHLIGDEPVCYSGDLVRIDDDGHYWFVSRKDSMIKSSGFRISPTEIEDAVSRSGMVMHVVAFGVDDELLGQAVEVVVTPLDGTRIEVEALLAFCRKTMPNYMIPKRVHVWPGDIPKTGSGKLDRPTILDAVRAA
jgi:acyl-CoA ligase (AMP-forming) (exosortase A-associated)